MKAHNIVLLLVMMSLAMPTLADKHGVKDNNQAADTSEVDDEEQEDIGDDAGLITDEFSYTYLFDQQYGVIAGFGKSSPRHLMHLEGLAFLREKLAISMLVGYGKDLNIDTEDNAYELMADTMSLSMKARYYLPLLPLSANASCGYVFLNGHIAPKETDDKQDYNASGVYLGVSLSAYYFWKNGIYIESVLYGLSGSKVFGLDTDKYEDTITEELQAVEHYGVFGGGLLNVAVGYML